MPSNAWVLRIFKGVCVPISFHPSGHNSQQVAERASFRSLTRYTHYREQVLVRRTSMIVAV